MGVLLWNFLLGISMFNSTKFYSPDTNGTGTKWSSITELCDRKDPKPSTQKLGSPRQIVNNGNLNENLFTNTFKRRKTLTVTR